MIEIHTQKITTEMEDEITAIYDTYGYGDSAHAFKTLYIWAKDMSLCIFTAPDLYVAKTAEGGDNTWFFPVGSTEQKIEFIRTAKEAGNLQFRFMTIEDVYFLQQHFPGKFVMDPAPNDSEYIYDRNTIENLPGGSFSRKRDYVRQLIRDHDVETKIFSKEVEDDVRQISKAWSRSKENHIDVLDKNAAEIILSQYKDLDITGVVIYLDDAPLAAVLGYKLSDDTVDCCLQKTDSYLHGLQYYMRQEFSRMQPPEVVFYNWEEDLGIEGLRTAKQYMHPCRMIDMYTGRQK